MTCRLSLRHLPAAAALALLGCFVSAEGEETGPASCNVAEDCADDGDPCTKPVCFHRTCMVEPVADGVIGDQAAGDCKTRECAGGELVDKDDPSDDDDSLLCTVDACGPGGATHTPLPDGAPCMIGAAIGECRGEDGQLIAERRTSDAFREGKSQTVVGMDQDRLTDRRELADAAFEVGAMPTQDSHRSVRAEVDGPVARQNRPSLALGHVNPFDVQEPSTSPRIDDLDGVAHLE